MRQNAASLDSSYQKTDAEDWWGDFDVNVPPPPIGRVYEFDRYARRKGMSPASRALMVLTAIVLVFCACLTLYRVSVIYGNSLEINTLMEAIEHEKTQIAASEENIGYMSDPARIDHLAQELGMTVAAGEQVRVIALSGTLDTGVVTANAQEGGQVSAAP